MASMVEVRWRAEAHDFGLPLYTVSDVNVLTVIDSSKISDACVRGTWQWCGQTDHLWSLYDEHLCPDDAHLDCDDTFVPLKSMRFCDCSAEMTSQTVIPYCPVAYPLFRDFLCWCSHRMPFSIDWLLVPLLIWFSWFHHCHNFAMIFAACHCRRWLCRPRKNWMMMTDKEHSRVGISC